jgi:hypothetical protein
MGGRLQVYEAEGGGAEFEIRLPGARPDPAETAAAATDPTITDTSETPT